MIHCVAVNDNSSLPSVTRPDLEKCAFLANISDNMSVKRGYLERLNFNYVKCNYKWESSNNKG